jgi:hypothetical protein
MKTTFVSISVFRFCLSLLAVLFLALAPVARAETVSAAPDPTPTPAPAPPQAAVVPEKTEPVKLSGNYTRFVRTGEDDYTMQLAVRTFRPAKKRGPKVTLVSAVHIGSKGYYANLQQILDAQRLLLFEGVSDDPDSFKQRSVARETSTGAEEKGDTLYDHLAKATGLSTQLEGIRYNRKHFQNADLSMREMRQRLQDESKRGGQTAREAREALQIIREMEGMLRGSGGFAMLMARGVFGVVGSSPQLRTLFLYQIGTVEDKKAAFSSSWVPPGLRRLERMILQERNEYAMGELKKVLSRKRPPRNVGIFYGAAHLPGMEEILVRQMGYRLEKTQWLTAFSLHPAAAGLPRPILDNIARRAKRDAERQ